MRASFIGKSLGKLSSVNAKRINTLFLIVFYNLYKFIVVLLNKSNWLNQPFGKSNQNLRPEEELSLLNIRISPVRTSINFDGESDEELKVENQVRVLFEI